MQRFEICDFVCKKVCIRWDRAFSGDLRQLLANPSLGEAWVNEYVEA
jgi:hypothetical protein